MSAVTIIMLAIMILRRIVGAPVRLRSHAHANTMASPLTSLLRCRAVRAARTCLSRPAAMQHGQWWLRGEVTVVDTRWRRLTLRCRVLLDHAAWEGALQLWRSVSSQRVQAECLHNTEFLSRRVNQWASIETCDKKKGGCGAILSYEPTALATASREAKAKAKAKAKAASSTIDQRAAKIIEGSPSEKEVCPRCGRDFFIVSVGKYDQIRRCLGWKLAGKPCTFIKAMHGERIIPGAPYRDVPTRSPESATSPSAPGGSATGYGGHVSGSQTATGELMRAPYGTALAPTDWVQQQQHQMQAMQQTDPAMLQAQLVQLQVVQQQLLEQLHHQHTQELQQAEEAQQHLREIDQWQLAESTGRMND
jgi:hypothetical protein